MTFDRSVEHLILRVAPMLFGVFAHTAGPKGERIVRVSGSGILVAPFFALTAAHVTRDLLRTDPALSDYLRKRKERYFDVPFPTGLIQVAPSATNPTHGIWGVTRTWNLVDTDIALMQVVADQGDALQAQFRMPTGFFELSLLPPPVGSEVCLFGFPGTEMAVAANGRLEGALHYTVELGTVTEIFEERRNSMYDFPCFSIDKPVDHGFSGGAVIWEDKLSGIISGGSLEPDGGTLAASLWPLCLLEYGYPDQPAVLGGESSVGDLFDRRALRSSDWKRIKGRVSRGRRPDGSRYARMDPE